MAIRKPPASGGLTDAEASCLRDAIHALGDYAHVSVRAQRGHFTVLVGQDDPVARLTPLGAGQYGLSFHRHTGQWDKMPIAGPLPGIARDLVDALGPYLERGDFPGGTYGSDH